MTELDALAIAVIRNRLDLAAWGSLCDYCEENGLNFHPRSLVLEIPAPIEVERKTYNLAYNDSRGMCVDYLIAINLQVSWASPLVEKTLGKRGKGLATQTSTPPAGQ